MSDFVIVYVTGPEAALLAIARENIGARLAACAHILSAGRSIYWWEGVVQEEPEQILLLKTRASLAAELTARIADRHPYDVPCVLVLPVLAGHDPYLDWLSQETTRPVHRDESVGRPQDQ